MRKLRKCIVVLLAMLPFMACESADNKIVEFSDLPSKAQKFVKTYFPDKTIALILCDESLFDKDYEVRFEDSSEVEFDEDGNWKSVEMKGGQAVPEGIVPAAIKTYIKTKHSNNFVIEIKKERKEYEVELNNGIDIVFLHKLNVKQHIFLCDCSACFRIKFVSIDTLENDTFSI